MVVESYMLLIIDVRSTYEQSQQLVESVLSPSCIVTRFREKSDSRYREITATPFVIIFLRRVALYFVPVTLCFLLVVASYNTVVESYSTVSSCVSRYSDCNKVVMDGRVIIECARPMSERHSHNK